MCKTMECFANLRAILVQGHSDPLCVVAVLVYELLKQARRLSRLHRKLLDIKPSHQAPPPPRDHYLLLKKYPLLERVAQEQ